VTRIFGYALDPESGHPRPGRQVSAHLYPVTRATLQGPVADGSDTVASDTDGRWELDLLPTAGSGRVIRLRCTGCFMVYADIPVATTGGAGDTSAIDVSTLLVDPTTLGPLPTDPSVYLPRVLLGVANGVASLGPDSVLTVSQWPPSGGTIGTPNTVVGGLDVPITSKWGINPSGQPYYNPDGAAPADAAIATLGADGLIHLTDTRGGVSTVAVTSVNGHTGTTVVVTKGDVGLGSVDNTSDAAKNSAAATLTNKTLTAPVINSPTGLVKGDVGLGNVDNTSDATKNSATATLTNKTLTAPVITSPTGLVKADVGLGSVDNVPDASKPVSTAQAAFSTSRAVAMALVLGS
jgi:hypothetical protein